MRAYKIQKQKYFFYLIKSLRKLPKSNFSNISAFYHNYYTVGVKEDLRFHTCIFSKPLLTIGRCEHSTVWWEHELSGRGTHFQLILRSVRVAEGGRGCGHIMLHYRVVSDEHLLCKKWERVFPVVCLVFGSWLPSNSKGCQNLLWRSKSQRPTAHVGITIINIPNII